MIRSEARAYLREERGITNRAELAKWLRILFRLDNEQAAIWNEEDEKHSDG